MHRTLSIIALATILTGCSMATLPDAPDRTFTIDASFDETWDALVRFASSGALPIENVEKNSGLLTINDTDAPVSMFQCRKRSFEPIVSVTARMSFLVAENENGSTTLTVNLSAIGDIGLLGVPSGRTAQCESLGEIEQRFIDGITENLGS